jgi:nucleotide-binding universal stress UspA family protein
MAILLATDGSEHAEAAADRAVELARARGVPLHVMCVVDRRVHEEPVLSSYELDIVAAEEEGTAAIEDIQRACEAVDVDADGTVRHGVPEDHIIDYAEEIGADTIVVGKHGDHTHHLGGVGRAVDDLSEREVRIVELEA